MRIDSLSKAQQAVLLASILADGELTKCYPNSRRKNNSYRGHFGQSQRFYREWKQRQLPDILYIRQNNLVSRSLPLMTELYPYFYPHHKKVIPFDLLSRCAHPLFLLILYLDDGSLMISKRINQNNLLYATPSIALYLQSFSKEELVPFCSWLNQTSHLNFRLSQTSNGSEYLLKTTRVSDALAFLEQVAPYTEVLPKFAYKLSWEDRFNQLQCDYSQYQVLTSNSSRPYTLDECNMILKLKENGWTTQAIADELKRTCWSVTYKLGQLKKGHGTSP